MLTKAAVNTALIQAFTDVRCNNGYTCRAITLAGGGVSLQPNFMIANDLRCEDLVEILPEFRSVELGIYVVYPTRKHLPAKVRALVDFW